MENSKTSNSERNVSRTVKLSFVGFFISLLSVIAMTLELIFSSPRSTTTGYLMMATIWSILVSSLILLVAMIIDIVLTIQKRIQRKSIFYNFLNLVLIIIYFYFDLVYLYPRFYYGG